jgi:hypothetical protein
MKNHYQHNKRDILRLNNYSINLMNHFRKINFYLLTI